jgi:hypothetical protein
MRDHIAFVFDGFDFFCFHLHIVEVFQQFFQMNGALNHLVRALFEKIVELFISGKKSHPVVSRSSVSP